MITLEAAPAGLFSRTFEVFEGGRPVGRLRFALRMRGSITIDGRVYRVTRDGWGGPFVLTRKGSIVASAVKPSAFRARFLLDVSGGDTYELAKAGLFTSAFALHGAGLCVGEISSRAFWSRKTVARLHTDVPRPVGCFALWLALMMRGSDAAAATNAAASSSIAMTTVPQ